MLKFLVIWFDVNVIVLFFFQASQVFLSLKNFLSLAHELKFRETEIPVLLKRRMDMVKDINWWLEGSVDECSVVFEEPEVIRYWEKILFLEKKPFIVLEKCFILRFFFSFS